MKEKLCIAGLAGTIASIIVIYISRQYIQQNLMIYFISLVCYLSFFRLFSLIPIEDSSKKKSKKGLMVGSVLVAVLLILGIHYIVSTTPFYGFYGWGIIPKWIVLGTIILSTWMSFCAILGGAVYINYCHYIY